MRESQRGPGRWGLKGERELRVRAPLPADGVCRGGGMGEFSCHRLSWNFWDWPGH